MADVNCRFELPEGKDLTVGDRFTWACEGSLPNLDISKTELRLEEADKYKLKLFRIQKGENGTLLLDVTSYVVGDHTIKAAQLVDAENSVLLGDLKFTVSSVQDPKEPIKEPFGPVPPVRFFPILFVVLIASAVVILLIPVFSSWLKRRRRRKLMEKLDARSFQYAAFPELHRELRAQQRQYLFLTDPGAEGNEDERKLVFGMLKETFQTYVSRQFRLPAFTWKAGRVMQTVAQETRLRENALKELGTTLREIERADKDPSKLTSRDLFQLVKMMKNTSEIIEREARRG